MQQSIVSLLSLLFGLQGHDNVDLPWTSLHGIQVGLDIRLQLPRLVPFKLMELRGAGMCTPRPGYHRVGCHALNAGSGDQIRPAVGDDFSGQSGASGTTGSLQGIGPWG